MIERSELLDLFRKEGRDLIHRMRDILCVFTEDIRCAGESARIEELFRCAHTLWGSSGSVGFQELHEIADLLQKILMRAEKGRVKLDTGIVLLLGEGVEACHELLEGKRVVKLEELRERLRAVLN